MLLSLQRISKRFERVDGAGRLALDDVSLELRRGQIVGVFGPSGTGKTTLLRIAAGLLTPDDGEVTYDGRRLDELPAGERMRLRRREIACVWTARAPQPGLEVLDHVALPLLVDGRDHRGAARRAREALAACEAEQCAGMMLDELSDGERQRVAIARAIVIEPRLLLADGPGRNLSLVEQETIMVLLQALAHEAKVAVLVTDSEATALIRADPVLYLQAGRLVNAPAPAKPGNVYEFPGRSRQAVADA
jgi:putative ABC transport system ATP-binding protein